MTETYTIRPLVWVQINSRTRWCETGSGERYSLAQDKWGWSWTGPDMDGMWPCDSLEAGKAAAESHWRDRISAALVRVDSTGDGR